MTENKKMNTPLGYLSRKFFFATLQDLSFLEEERLEDGKFDWPTLKKARERARFVWRFLKKGVWDTREAAQGMINSPDHGLISWKEDKGRRIEFRYLDLFFSIEVEERGDFHEKVVTILLRKTSDNGSMELKSEIPLTLSSLVSDGLPF